MTPFYEDGAGVASNHAEPSGELSVSTVAADTTRPQESGSIPAPEGSASYTPVPITQDLVERLRRGGASDDLIEFTERHVTRYSQADLERAQTRAAVWVLAIEAVVGILVLVFR